MNERDNLKYKLRYDKLLIFWYFDICDIFDNDNLCK